MRNPPIRLRRKSYRRRNKPLKTRLLSYLVTYTSSDEIINNAVAVRKALKQIVEDDEMWNKITKLNGSIKELAKYGIERGY